MILALAVVLGIWFVVESSTQRLLARAASAVERKDFAEAERLATIVLQRDPTSVQALFLAGVSAKEDHGVEAAIAYIERIPDDGTTEAAQALFAGAEFAYQAGHAKGAEELYLRVVELDPSHTKTRERLIFIYAAQGRMWEITQQLLPLLQLGVVDRNHLIAVGSPNKLMLTTLPFVQRCLDALPDDPLPRLLEAKWAIHDKKPDEARAILERIVEIHPDIVDAQAELGQVLLEFGTSEELVAWHDRLPGDADAHPDIWLVRGLWATKLGQMNAAARCFGEAVRRAPNHPAANSQLSMALTAVGQPAEAEKFAARSRKLSRMVLLINELSNSGNVREAVRTLRDLGRMWEAAGWCRIAMANDSSWAKPMLDQLLYELSDQQTLTKRSSNLALQLDLSEYKLPEFQRAPPPDQPPPSVASANSRISFREVAAEVGLAFTYFNGTVGDQTESLFALDGGGVGVLDYDLDGWPDLCLTQGGPLPRRVKMPPHSYRDCLFRNQDGESFVDVSARSHLHNTLYSQGLAVGDIDADGFPDLYIANIGANVLYRNNGDGTFQEVSTASGTQGNVWTSSCLIADLNGDALPDIYAVNYIGGDKLYTQECKTNVTPRCAPTEHPAEQDKLYVNGGDGTFADVTDDCGVVAPEGRGLGIVAADFDGSQRVSLFVANDMSANFFFENQTSALGNQPTFAEHAALIGLAYNSAGIAQACMGVAASDANQDGLLDLFVTNFYRDSNAFYVQLPDGSFRDEIAASQVEHATFPVLGWGTQFIDAELDGIPDLLVTNGHVHDPSDKNTPYHMQPQFFHGQGAGRFEEVPAEQLGPYFEGRYLGRAMARLDWNRDGLEDVCIGHLDSPSALVSNETIDHGHWLSLTLVGVDTNRDAIGTVVRITCDDRTSVRQMTAGDGFQCSNERRLVCGLGSGTLVDQIQVNWPSGLEQTFGAIEADQELIIVEGNPTVFVRD